MKRKIFAVLALGALAVVSCKKDEPVAPASPGSATVQGTLWADLDVANDTDNLGNYLHKPEFVPAGVRVTAIVDSYDLDKNPDPSYTYEKLKFVATVGTSGSYSFTNIPCYNESIDVELKFNDFTATQKISGSVSETKIFTLPDATVTVYDGAIVINDYTYND